MGQLSINGQSFLANNFHPVTIIIYPIHICLRDSHYIIIITIITIIPRYSI